MRVICTAGHVDHGKSALVKALTGMEPDRFAEERARGLTIDLGFAWTSLPATAAGETDTVAFVDVPGHERFVTNMLAGAGGVDLALFVVAADEGWMPQSQEHLDILDLLGVRRGLIALTKADLVDADTLEIGAELIREQVAGSGLADAELLAVSAATGEGLAELSARLAALLAEAPPAADRGRPRLWVDRSFSITGAGTVVTGTLTSGALTADGQLAVLPAGRAVRVRGLQALGEPVTRAQPGSRVAVNLGGLDRADVGRGDALAHADQWLAVTAFDAWIRVLPGFVVSRRGDWHVHIGAGERLAGVYPLDGERLEGDTGFVRVELDAAVTVCAGDRFVLRESGRNATVGGGVIVDADPPARPRGRQRLTRQAQLEARHDAVDAAPELLTLAAAERGAIDRRRAAAATGVTAAEVAAAVDAGRVLDLGDSVADPAAVAVWRERVVTALAAYHAEHPVERGAPKDVALRAATAAGCPGRDAEALVSLLVARGELVAEGPGVRTPGHAVRLDPAQTAARDALLAALAAEPFAPPSLTSAADDAGASAALVRELEAAGELVRLDADVAVTAATLDEAAERLRAAYASEGPLTAARAKEVLGTSRKYALPVLEELDRRGVTRRMGDVREVR